MKRVREQDLNIPWLRLMLYGPPGSTKTRTAGTAALDNRTYPTLWLDLAGNPISIRSYERLPTILQVEGLGDFNAVYDFISKGQPLDHQLARDLQLKEPFKCLVVDSCTTVQRSAFGKAVGTLDTPVGQLPKTAERQHFNQVLGYMVNWSDKFYALPIHVILTCLEAEKTDQQTGSITYGPLLWGQSAGEVPGFALMVARLVHRAKMSAGLVQEVTTAVNLKIVEDPITEKTVSVALLRPSGKYSAKDQYGTGQPYIVDPTITKILDAIEKKE